MKKIHFFYQNYNLSLASIKHVQITEEAFQLSKENIQQIKREISEFFSNFVGHFCPPESGSEFRIQIRIH